MRRTDEIAERIKRARAAKLRNAEERAEIKRKAFLKNTQLIRDLRKLGHPLATISKKLGVCQATIRSFEQKDIYSKHRKRS